MKQELLSLPAAARVLGLTAESVRQLAHGGRLGELTWQLGANRRPCYHVRSRAIIDFLIRDGEELLALQNRLYILADSIGTETRLAEELRRSADAIADRFAGLRVALSESELVPAAAFQGEPGVTPATRSGRAKP